MVSIIAVLNGVSASIVFSIGVMIIIKFMHKFFTLKKKLAPFVAFLGMGVSFFFLGPTTSFISLVATGSNIPGTVYGLLSYTTTPLTVAVAMFLGFDIFMPKLRKKVSLLYVVSGAPFWVLLLGFPAIMIQSTHPAPGELIDISFHPAVMAIIGFYIFSVLFVLGRGFYNLYRRLSLNKEFEREKRKAMYLLVGWILFSIAAVADTIVAPGLVVFARIVMILGVYYIQRGFS